MRNRLASNSLLESLVFAQRAAADILFGEPPAYTGGRPDLALYKETEPLFAAEGVIQHHGSHQHQGKEQGVHRRVIACKSVPHKAGEQLTMGNF